MKNLLIVFALFLVAFTLPQEEYKLSNKNHFEVKGTSTMHDWNMETRQAKGSAAITIQDGQVTGIDRLKISLPAESLQSGKSAMDKNAYSTLKTNKHPEITFDLVGVEKLERNGNATQIRSKGKLTIAGTSRTEELVVHCRTNAKGEVSFEGSKEIKMSDYGIEAPSFMFGSVKTGDEVTVSFNIQFDRGSNL